MYFENAGHLGGDAENDIPKKQRISVTLPEFPIYFGDVILSIPAQMSFFGHSFFSLFSLFKVSLHVEFLPSRMLKSQVTDLNPI